MKIVQAKQPCTVVISCNGQDGAPEAGMSGKLKAGVASVLLSRIITK